MTNEPNDDDRRSARVDSEKRAHQVGVSGDFLHVPTRANRENANGRTGRMPKEFRSVNRRLSRRRKFEFLEPLLCFNFRNATVFLRKRTDLTEELILKYDSLREDGPMYFSGKEGAIELRVLFEDLRITATKILQRRSTVEWLLMIRRTFIAQFDGESMAPEWFVESFIRRSTKTNVSTKFYGRRFRTSPSDLKDLHDLLLITAAMWQVGRAFRTVVKGLVVTIARGPTYVGAAAMTDPKVAEAIEAFESRKGQRFRGSIMEPSPMSGTVRRRRAPDPEPSPFPGSLARFYEFGSLDDRHKYFLRWRTHYRPGFLDPSELLDRKTSQPPSIRSLAAAVVLGACWDDIGLNDPRRRRAPSGQWALWGVHTLTSLRLTEVLDGLNARAMKMRTDWSTPAARTALMGRSKELEWMDGDLAIVFQFSEDLVLVDLIAATRAVENPYRRPSAGAQSVEWTAHFEDQVQGVIDATRWAPSGSVRSLRHRTLRREDGTAITEVDAIGVLDDILLFVSVKAWTQPEMLEFGEYGSIGNRMVDVESAVSDWQNKIKQIALHPDVARVAKGARVVGVVVSPEVQYTLLGAATEEILPGLPAASSYWELEQFLSEAL